MISFHDNIVKVQLSLCCLTQLLSSVLQFLLNSKADWIKNEKIESSYSSSSESLRRQKTDESLKLK